jgi:dTDP-glucose 4,6-dehydratase
MKILLTGAGGFIPSHVAQELIGRGHSVRALVHYNSRGSWGHLQHVSVSSQIEVHLGDVTDAFQMQRLMQGCDMVVHMAALIGIPYSYEAPASYLATNTQGTLNILEAARVVGVKRVIITSTSEVYGTARYTPIDEAHPLQAQSPYSASKIAADKLAEAYYRSFDLPVVVLRPFNTYGPRQSQRAVIPTILAQALNGKTEIRLGSLTPQRDLTFVEDTARAFGLALEAPGIEGEVIHFGQGWAVSVGEIAERCLVAAGSTAQIVQETERVRPGKSEVGLLLCNPVKAKQLLGWEPKISLEEGLARTARYIQDNLALYQAGRYTI